MKLVVEKALNPLDMETGKKMDVVLIFSELAVSSVFLKRSTQPSGVRQQLLLFKVDPKGEAIAE